MLQWQNHCPRGKADSYESGGWKIKAAPFIIVDNQKANIIGRIILPQVGIRLIQEKSKQGNVLNISEQEQSNPEIKRWVKDNYPQLRIRVGKSKSNVMRTQFNKEFIPVQQKVRRVPVHLQERVEKEFNELLDQKHIIKLDTHSDRQLISPIVITVRKDQTVKLALDSKIINKFIHKNKYQTPNIDLLLDNVAQVVKSNDNQQTLFSTLDLRYAFSQIPLDKSTQEQCNFSLIGGIATGTYQFQTGFYGLTDMPAELQKVIDLTLTNCSNFYAYLDYILILTKRSIVIHKQKLQTFLEKLDGENLAILLEKCKFACK